MSVSLKNTPKISKYLEKINFISVKREKSTGKSHNQLFSKYSININAEKHINSNLCILKFITSESQRKYSTKTSNSESNPIIYNYDLHMINKYDENLNSSLSFISDFDLEEDEENQIDESFNSCENDDSEIEQIEIKNSSKQVFRDNIDEENDVKLEKDWNDIQNFLLNKLTK